MNRQEAINALCEIASIFVEEMELTEVKKDDISCGIWDNLGTVKMSDLIKRKYGDMEEVTYHNGKDVVTKYGSTFEKYVRLGYRFDNPKLCIFDRDENGKQTLASIELTDGANDANGNYIHTGDYRFGEAQTWGIKGFKTQQRLMKMWAERNK